MAEGRNMGLQDWERQERWILLQGILSRKLLVYIGFVDFYLQCSCRWLLSIFLW